MSSSPSTAPASTPWTYRRLTRTATYGFLGALPLLALYEVLILLVNRGKVYQIHVGAEVWIKRVLLALGGTGMVSVGIVTLFVGIGIFLYERKKHLPFRPAYLGWMIVESTVYAVVIALLISNVVGMLFSIAPLAKSGAVLQEQDFGTMLSLSIGAGIYEELVFRVLLVGGLYWVLHRFFHQTVVAYLVAAVVGALVFSGVHYTGALGDAFTLSSFTFRFLFGLSLNALFLVRGFGVAAWTHALYDIMIVSHFLG